MLGAYAGLQVPDISVGDAQKNLKKSLEKGILKILSKMGISLLGCYHGAQIFEAYGLSKEVRVLGFSLLLGFLASATAAAVKQIIEVCWGGISKCMVHGAEG
jgi:glutamate synthase (ferredoxin)